MQHVGQQLTAQLQARLVVMLILKLRVRGSGFCLIRSALGLACHSRGSHCGQQLVAQLRPRLVTGVLAQGLKFRFKDSLTWCGWDIAGRITLASSWDVMSSSDVGRKLQASLIMSVLDRAGRSTLASSS